MKEIPFLLVKRMFTAQGWRQCRPTVDAQNFRPYVKTRSPAPPFMGKVKQRGFSQPSCGLFYTAMLLP